MAIFHCFLLKFNQHFPYESCSVGEMLRDERGGGVQRVWGIVGFCPLCLQDFIAVSLSYQLQADCGAESPKGQRVCYGNLVRDNLGLLGIHCAVNPMEPIEERDSSAIMADTLLGLTLMLGIKLLSDLLFTIGSLWIGLTIELTTLSVKLLMIGALFKELVSIHQGGNVLLLHSLLYPMPVRWLPTAQAAYVYNLLSGNFQCHHHKGSVFIGQTWNSVNGY
ncbi:hypothetical protein CHUAL_013967 [Chamberlinius hualienensis]